MTIYVAAPFRRQRPLRLIRDLIHRDTPHRVCATWIDADDRPQEDTPLARFDELARRDLRDLECADLVIVETLEEGRHGGMHVEFGYALGRAVPCWRVGPVRHIFHVLAQQTFDEWADVIDRLRACN